MGIFINTAVETPNFPSLFFFLYLANTRKLLSARIKRRQLAVGTKSYSVPSHMSA
jgi:hypothetical protein